MTADLVGAAGERSRAQLSHAESLIASVPDYPLDGVVFRDLTPLFADARAFSSVVEAFATRFEGSFDAVAGLEARGFLLAGALAIRSGTGLVPIRKAGKLPRETASVDYALEYGTATIEVHRDDLPVGSRVLVLDDVLATGGTLRAALDLAVAVGWTVSGIGVVLELDALGGRAALDVEPFSLFHA